MAAELRRQRPGGLDRARRTERPHARLAPRHQHCRASSPRCPATSCAWARPGRSTPTPATAPVPGRRNRWRRSRKRCDARGGCAARRAGVDHRGRRRRAAPGRSASVAGDSSCEGCRALAGQLRRWSADPACGGRPPVQLPRRPGLPGGPRERRPAAPAPRRTALWLSLARPRAAGASPRAVRTRLVTGQV